jgi:hypothetical protein
MDLRTAVIKKCRQQDHDDRPAGQQRWCLYTRDGKKLLGRHPSKAKALKQERAIQVRKHGSAQLVLFHGAVYRRVDAERLTAPMDPEVEKRSVFEEMEILLLALEHAIDVLPRAENLPNAVVVEVADQRKFRQTVSHLIKQLRWVSWRCRWQPSR